MKKNKTQFKRINVLQEGKNIIISISGKIERWKETLLFSWLIAWMICGIAISYELFNSSSTKNNTFLFIYLCFWAYFFFKIGYAYLYRKWGQELIKIEPDKILIRREIKNIGKTYSYTKENIKDFDIYRHSDTSFLKIFNDSFWVIGGERLMFEYFGSKTGFGIQLNKDEENYLYKLIKSHIG